MIKRYTSILSLAIAFGSITACNQQAEIDRLKTQNQRLQDELAAVTDKRDKDDLLTACIEFGATRKGDGAQRVRILRDAGVPADRLEGTLNFLEMMFQLGMTSEECVEQIERKMREPLPE